MSITCRSIYAIGDNVLKINLSFMREWYLQSCVVISALTGFLSFFLFLACHYHVIYTLFDITETPSTFDDTLCGAAV